MAKFEIPLDGSDPNDKNSGQQNLDNGENLSDNGSPQKGVAQKAGEIGQDALKNSKNALQKNGTNLKGAATDAIAGTAKDTAQKTIGEANPEAAEKVGEATEKVTKLGSTAIMVKGAVASISQWASAAVALLVDPITWIVIAVIAVIIVLVIGIIAGVQVFGKTDNADGCYGIGMYGQTGSGGSLSINVPTSADSMANASTIADWAMTTNFTSLGNKPMNREQAAGLIGNMWQESTVNPAASQSSSISSSSSNSEVMNLGKGNGGRAIGLIQWDSERRFYLAQYAESKGKPWSDLGVQLEFLKMEFEGTAPYPGATYNRDLVLQKGFGDTGESIEHYTEAWEKGFTRAGQPMMNQRINYANSFNSAYSPGSGAAFSSSSSGGSCLTSGSMSGAVDTSDSVNLAIQIAYPTVDESRTGGDQMGTSKAKPEYVTAKDKAQQIGSKDGMPSLYASCDRAVATVVINTMDPNYPWGNIVTQRKYAESNPNKWKKYSNLSEAKPGDVWITKPGHDGGGHTVMYLGTINGQDMIMHASYSQRGNSRVAALQPRASYISDAMTDKSGRGYYGFSYVGG